MLPGRLAQTAETTCVLGCGAEIKNTFCVTTKGKAFVSWDTGDLTDYAAYVFYRESVQELLGLLDAGPAIAAHDLHPDYVSTRYAEQSGIRKLEPVQHHHAHIAAGMVEHGLEESVIGVALDGMGLGDDGTLWGGEFLVADLAGYRRPLHFKAYPLPGGDQGTRNPERMALSCLLSEGEEEERIAGILPGMDDDTRRVLGRMIGQGVNSPLTSSAGRLFDAVSALLGLCSSISFEAEAAIRLQEAAVAETDEVYPFEIADGVVDFGPMLGAIVIDVENGAGKERAARMFHNTVAAAVVGACTRIRSSAGTAKTVLSGGVFQNALLKGLIIDGLRDAGFEVYHTALLPPTDANLSLGQAAVALARSQRTTGN